MDAFQDEKGYPVPSDAGMSAPVETRARPRCAAIIMDDPVARSEEMEAAIARMKMNGMEMARVANPLSAALTARRILIQLDLADGEEDSDENDEARLVRLLERRSAHNRIALVIEQAETLAPDVLPALRQLTTGPGSAQVLFVGTATFWTLLNKADFASFRRALIEPMTDPPVKPPPGPPHVEVAPVSVSPGSEAESVVDMPARPGALHGAEPWVRPVRPRRRWLMGSIVSLCALLGLALMMTLFLESVFYRASPWRAIQIPRQAPAKTQPRATPPAAEPLASPSLPAVAPTPLSVSPPRVASSPTTRPAPPPDPGITPEPPSVTGTPFQLSRESPPPGSPLPTRSAKEEPARPEGTGASLPLAPRSESRLTITRTDFDRFLIASGHGERLTEAQRDRLFQEYMTGRSVPVAKQGPLSPTEGRAVIHYREGSAAGETVANLLATRAAPFVAKVQTRLVAETPSKAEIRFFHPEDASRAHQLGESLRALQPGLDVRNFSAFRPSPSPGTIEVWVPAR